MPARGGIARRSKRDRRAVDADLAGVGLMQAEDRFEQLRSAGSDETEEPDDLAARHGQTDVPKVSGCESSRLVDNLG